MISKCCSVLLFLKWSPDLGTVDSKNPYRKKLHLIDRFGSKLYQYGPLDISTSNSKEKKLNLEKII